ncbi:MAG: NACHT domain-containing protein [Acidobacteria bacterium]|nr:NACHT domain-containing protein [Acidobacteriota bacterium]
MASNVTKDLEGSYALRLSWRYREVDFLGLPHLKDNRPVRLENIYVPLRLAWEMHNRRDKEKTFFVPKALQESRHLVVLGDPGSGKSTLVKVLTHAFGQSASSAFKRMFGELLPVPIILRDYKVRRWNSPEEMLSDFIRTLDAEIRDEITPEWLLDHLRGGRGFLLIDGLDEVGSVTDRKQLRDKVVRPLLAQMPDSLALLTSRLVGYEEAPFEGYVDLKKYPLEAPYRGLPPTIRRCYVAPFSDEDIEQFIVRWYKVREAHSDRQREGIESFKRALHQNDRVRRLADNPQLLTLMALVHRVTANLPSGRVKLYDKIVEAYLETISVYRKMSVPATLDEMKRWLAKVGWEMQERRDEQEAEELLVHRDEVLRWLTDAITRERGASGALEDAEKFLDYVARRAGLLIPRGQDTEGKDLFAFVHLTFQEYFAAFELRGRVRRFDSLAQDCVERVTKPHWHETLNILFEMLNEFPGACDDLFDVMVKQTASLPKKRRSTAEFFSALLLDEQNGLSDKKQRAAADFTLASVCENYDDAIIKNLRDLEPEPKKTLVSDWFDSKLREATANGFSKYFFLVGAELFADWHIRLSEWIESGDYREPDKLQVAEIALIGACDADTSRKFCPWAVEHLPLDMWLRRISFWTGHSLSLADIYRQEIYATYDDTIRQHLFIEASVAAAFVISQLLRTVVAFLRSALARGLARTLARDLERDLDRALAIDLDGTLVRALAHALERVLDRALVRALDPALALDLAFYLHDGQALHLDRALNAVAPRPELKLDKAGITSTFALSEWIFFAPDDFDKEGATLIKELTKLAQAPDDWTRLLAISALLSLGYGTPELCGERNALLEKGIKRSPQFTFPAALHPETETTEFRNQLPELFDIIFLHNPDDPWLRPELFDPARPEAKYFLVKPREFFILAAEALDPEGETELTAWRKKQS